MKKALTILIIILISVILVSCKDDPEQGFPKPSFVPFTADAGANVFVNHPDIHQADSIIETITVGRYNFERIELQEGLIIYSKERENQSLYDKAYAVKNLDGGDVINFSAEAADDIIHITVSNGFIIAKKPDETFSVYNSEGTRIISDIYAESVTALSDRHIRADFREGKSKVYLDDGKDIFPLVTLPLKSDTIRSAEEYICVSSSIRTNIFNNNGYLVKGYFNSDDVKYTVNYLHEDRFLIIRNTYLTGSGDYEVLADDKYIKQDLIIYEAEKDAETNIDIGVTISDFINGYITPSVNNELKSGYSLIKAYNIREDRTVDGDKPYTDYAVDSYMNLCIRLEDGVFPFLHYKNNRGTENNGLNARLIGLDGNILWEAEESVNIVQGYNDGKIIAGRITEDGLKFAAYNESGGNVTGYEYDALSLFTDCVAIGLIGETYYRLDNTGEREEITYDIIDFVSLQGFFMTEEEGYKKLYNLNGTAIIDQSKSAKSMTIYTGRDSVTYAAVTDSADIVKIYVIS